MMYTKGLEMFVPDLLSNKKEENKNHKTLIRGPSFIEKEILGSESIGHFVTKQDNLS